MRTPFEITSEEGLPIVGDFEVAGTPRALVILIHGFKGFKEWGFFPWLSEQLCKAGYAVCRFNMSRCGVTGNGDTFDRLDLFADDTYAIALSDLHAVVDHARSRYPLPAHLLGFSRGGGVALLGASDIPDLRTVVTWSAIGHVNRWDDATVAKWRAEGFSEVLNTRTKQIMRVSTALLDDYDANRERYDVLAAASRLTVPLLVVHGGSDETVPVAEAREIASRVTDTALLIVENASHTYNAIHPLITIPNELSIVTEVTTHFLGLHSK